jgi:hypothetical protein
MQAVKTPGVACGTVLGVSNWAARDRPTLVFVACRCCAVRREEHEYLIGSEEPFLSFHSGLWCARDNVVMTGGGLVNGSGQHEGAS